MCSNIVLVVYMIGIIGGAGLCISGLATDGWFAVVDKNNDVHWKSLFSCFYKHDNYCRDIWDNASQWTQATIALTIMGIIACGLAVAWSCFLCCTCCCTSCLGHPLPILALLAFVCQLTACIIYGVRVHPFNINVATQDPVHELGWSYILVIIGTVAYLVDAILGGIIVACGKI